MASSLGNLVRLKPLGLDELPPHPSLPDTAGTSQNGDGASAPSSTKRPDLSAFLKAILEEGEAFIESFPQTSKSIKTVTSSPSTAKVALLKREVSETELSNISWSSSEVRRSEPTTAEKTVGEFWVARRSQHVDKDEKGTASWEQFEFGLREDHSNHERDFTPTLYDARTLVDWSDQLHSTGSVIGEFSNVHMSIHEMCHKIPPPLNPRCFPVLVVTANLPPSIEKGFIAITIPVDIRKLSSAFYSNGRNTKEGLTSMERKTPVLGVYTAVETVKKMPDGKIDWLMATASDAKGVLPMFIQKTSVPGAVAKDVGLFLAWIDKDVRKQSLSDFTQPTRVDRVYNWLAEQEIDDLEDKEYPPESIADKLEGLDNAPNKASPVQGHTRRRKNSFWRILADGIESNGPSMGI